MRNAVGSQANGQGDNAYCFVGPFESGDVVDSVLLCASALDITDLVGWAVGVRGAVVRTNQIAAIPNSADDGEQIFGRGLSDAAPMSTSLVFIPLGVPVEVPLQREMVDGGWLLFVFNNVNGNGGVAATAAARLGRPRRR